MNNTFKHEDFSPENHAGGHQKDTIQFAEQGTGPLEIVPLTATTLQETITPTFISSSGPLLQMGILHTGIDPAATDISKLLFDAHFVLSSPDGDSLFGTYSLTLSQFSTPTNETFAGVFTATGGTGAYAGFTGSGTFQGTNVYADATDTSATTDLSLSGVLTRQHGGPGIGGFGGGHCFG
jgi:hypothetical protein